MGWLGWVIEMSMYLIGISFCVIVLWAFDRCHQAEKPLEVWVAKPGDVYIDLERDTSEDVRVKLQRLKRGA